MPLHFSEPPADFRQALIEGLEKMSAAYRTHDASNPLGGEFTATRLRMPHPVYSAALSDLKSGAGVASASIEGWRAFLEDAPPIRVAEATTAPEGRRPIFLGLSVGPQVDYTLQLLLEFERDSLHRPLTFIPRLLRVNTLYLSCLWLSNEDATQDIFIPIPPVFGSAAAEKQHRRPDFDQLLTSMASARVPNRKTLFAR
jgi:hypothetical protein